MKWNWEAKYPSWFLKYRARGLYVGAAIELCLAVIFLFIAPGVSVFFAIAALVTFVVGRIHMNDAIKVEEEERAADNDLEEDHRPAEPPAPQADPS